MRVVAPDPLQRFSEGGRPGVNRPGVLPLDDAFADAEAPMQRAVDRLGVGGLRHRLKLKVDIEGEPGVVVQRRLLPVGG